MGDVGGVGRTQWSRWRRALLAATIAAVMPAVFSSGAGGSPDPPVRSGPGSVGPALPDAATAAAQQRKHEQWLQSDDARRERAASRRRFAKKDAGEALAVGKRERADVFGAPITLDNKNLRPAYCVLTKQTVGSGKNTDVAALCKATGGF